MCQHIMHIIIVDHKLVGGGGGGLAVDSDTAFGSCCWCRLHARWLPLLNTIRVGTNLWRDINCKLVWNISIIRHLCVHSVVWYLVYDRLILKQNKYLVGCILIKWGGHEGHPCPYKWIWNKLPASLCLPAVDVLIAAHSWSFRSYVKASRMTQEVDADQIRGRQSSGKMASFSPQEGPHN